MRVIQSIIAAVATAMAFIPLAHAEETQQKSSQPKSLYGVIASSIKSDDVRPIGFIISHGPAQQNYLQLKVTDKLSAIFWSTYDFNDEKLHEADLGIDYSFPIGEAFKGRVSVQRWLYPSGLLGDKDDAAEIEVGYKGPIQIDVKVNHLLSDGWSWDRNLIHAKVSKVLPLTKTKRIQIIPQAEAAFGDNYYGVDGASKITPGVALRWDKGKWSLTLSGSYQIGLLKNIEDLVYGGFSAGYGF